MTPPRTALDHLVVAAETLDAGLNWVENRLGVRLPAGGTHDHMATHNCVGRIGDDIYLEIIAINPDDTPDRVRWFSMDEPSVNSRLQREGAFLHHWVINTTDIHATLTAATHVPGPAMDMSRGNLQWKISVRDDGVIARDGLLPTVIQWPDIPHPSRHMQDLGVRLERIELQTPDPDGLRRDLAAIGADHLCTITQGAHNALVAQFTKNGSPLEL